MLVYGEEDQRIVGNVLVNRVVVSRDKILGSSMALACGMLVSCWMPGT
jgi:hypothetical protein